MQSVCQPFKDTVGFHEFSYEYFVIRGHLINLMLYNQKYQHGRNMNLSGSGLVTGWSPSKESYSLKSGKGPTKGCSVIHRSRDILHSKPMCSNKMATVSTFPLTFRLILIANTSEDMGARTGLDIDKHTYKSSMTCSLKVNNYINVDDEKRRGDV
jgi:hypothetical protein